ncbi:MULTISPECIES: GNAT family N-acetyltransferase [Micromonospora]|uniref:GNAT family N-acetyltransferase n=1 Tax=Micromonospora solifontis TaxID=2487138 RepID=A0ABX9WL96_9ACTN|nr:MULTISPECIES: GNAT family N-acetyltransferase [Micromonospora]NES14380.1 GNAT family N-acetyltransferase [Micromonospora sp. PPF5-17B]NES35012.1 GNAT family N-acetyltransferase [Micromonospora solifontis]NES57487.1 GNAT family N-acetyltransferase [Micromonospora sp. PPF5-6]RNM01284.1 GNAT family N-acetyltransferase [Micromonospora solifontis]
MTLPAGWTARRPTLDDVPAILAVVHAADTFAVGYPDFDAEDVRDALTAPFVDMTRDSWLVTDPDGVAAGWTILSNPTGVGREFVEVYVDPERGAELRAPLLARLLDRVAERAAERGLPALTARTAAFAPETRWAGELAEAGFTLVKRYLRMTRSLADLPAEPSPPAGVTVRPLRPDDEADLREFHRIFDTAFRDTPDYEPLGFDQWREMLPSYGKVWDEWFIAEVDGVPAGALQSSDQAVDQDMGWVRTLSVLPTYRRRGVGAALLRRAFAVFAAKGRSGAGLGVDLANPTVPVTLYRSVGLREGRWTDMYERVVTATAV